LNPRPLLSPNTLRPSSSYPSISPNPLSSLVYPESELDYFEYEELEDPELEVRWGRVQELVESMKMRGQRGLLRKEEMGGVKVLGWEEVERRAVEGVDEGEGDKDGEVETGDISVEVEDLSELGDVSAEI
jgi:hypothetical protein